MTKIDYPDIVQFSPSSNLRLEIRSPDNDKNVPSPHPINPCRMLWGGFQSNFVFTVFYQNTEKIMWQVDAHNTPFDAPIAAWIHDDGNVIVITKCTFGSYLYILNSQGKLVFECDVIEDILKDEEVFCSSAGPGWYQRGFGVFFQVKSEHYFCFQTVLGRQIILDLETYKRKKVSSFLFDSMKDAQRKWAFQILEKASKDSHLFQEGVIDRESHWDYYDQIWAASFFASTDKLFHLIPYLEKLEHSTVWSGCTSGWQMSDKKDTVIVILKFVPVIQRTLRNLNYEPKGYSAYWLCGGEEEPCKRVKLDIPECIPDRSIQIKKIDAQMAPCDVVTILGMPNVMRKFLWHYDLSDEKENPHTIEIQWDWSEEKRIKTIKTLPPMWKDPYKILKMIAS